jgi:hypothetical protein
MSCPPGILCHHQPDCADKRCPGRYSGPKFYSGPAKRIPMYRRPISDHAEVIVFLSGIIVVLLDVFVFRANI